MAYWVASNCFKFKPRIFDALQNQMEDHINIDSCPLTEKHGHGWTVWKVWPKFLNFVVCNPCQSSPSLTILVPQLWFIVISLVFFYLFKVLFSGFLQLKGKFVDGQNNSKYRDCAPLLKKNRKSKKHVMQ